MKLPLKRVVLLPQECHRGHRARSPGVLPSRNEIARHHVRNLCRFGGITGTDANCDQVGVLRWTRDPEIRTEPSDSVFEGVDPDAQIAQTAGRWRKYEQEAIRSRGIANARYADNPRVSFAGHFKRVI